MQREETYELFKTKYEFHGRHARMVSELWSLNDYEHTYFKRLVDIYILASVVGFRMNRKGEEDYSPVDTRTIFQDQMTGAKEELDFILQMMILLDEKSQDSNEDTVKKAFRGIQTKEEYLYYKNMMEAYMLGGVEELYERLILRTADISDNYQDEKTANIMEMISRFQPKEQG